MPTVKEVHIDSIDYDSDDVATGSAQSGYSTGCIVTTILISAVVVIGGGIGLYFGLRTSEKKPSTTPVTPEPEKPTPEKPTPENENPEKPPVEPPLTTPAPYSVELIRVSNQNEASGCFAILGDKFTGKGLVSYSPRKADHGASECRQGMALLLEEKASHEFKAQLAKRVLITDAMCQTPQRNAKYGQFFGGNVMGSARNQICGHATAIHFLNIEGKVDPAADENDLFNLLEADPTVAGLVEFIFKRYRERLTVPANASHQLEPLEVKGLIEAVGKLNNGLANGIMVGKNIRLSDDAWGDVRNGDVQQSVTELSRVLTSSKAGRARLAKLYNEGFGCESKRWHNNFIVKDFGGHWNRVCIKMN